LLLKNVVEENTEGKDSLQTLRQKMKDQEAELNALRTDNKSLMLSSTQAEAEAKDAQNSKFFAVCFRLTFLSATVCIFFAGCIIARPQFLSFFVVAFD